ncbi:MAG: sugar phosphate isomerase/epimerase [Thermoguttaceae bacterium]|nr:sugar phosphate isomerase/epimerase [Thermoguttaceae bacterium]
MKKLIFAFSFILLSAVSALADGPASTIGNNDWFKGKVGVNMYSYRQLASQDLAKAMDVAKEVGFVYVECNNPYGHSLEEYRKMVDERGFIPVSRNFGFDLWEKDPEQTVKDAITLGVKYAGTAYLPCKKGQAVGLTEEEVRHHAEVINRAAKLLAEHGMKFQIHNHSQEFAPYKDGKTMFDLLMELTDPENVVVELDITWVAYPWKADPVEIIQKYPNRVKLMHVKDFTPAPDGKYHGSVPVGKGSLPLKEILQAAQEAGVEYYLIEDEGNQPLIDVPETIRNMEEMK